MEALARKLPRHDTVARPSYVSVLDRLSDQSVRKGTSAYTDIEWMDIDVADPRWQLRGDDPIGATDWYRSLPPAQRTQLGLHCIVAKMKLGIAFENVLMRGLIDFAATLPNGSPNYRYAHHEVAEEVQHSLMFQEFINRSGLDVPGLSPGIAWLGRRISALGRRFPELFFIFVLGGETPVDYEQRRALAKHDFPALFTKIMRVHVTEEARHVHFARHYLMENVPRLSVARRARIAWSAPIIASQMAGMMLRVPRYLAGEYDIPRAVFTEAYHHNAQHRLDMTEAVAPIQKACKEAGLVTTRSAILWRTVASE